MSEIIADPLSPSCSLLFSRSGIEESQKLAPDPSLRRARRARALRQGKLRQPERPAARHSQSQMAPADLVARPLGARSLSDLIDRKPHLLQPLAALVLPPLAAIDPAARLGIDLSSLRTVEDFRQVLSTVLAAVARGEIAPAEAARIARRGRTRLRAARRLARLAPVRA